ncbi:MAG: UDP-N-acetylmuramate--L-alanine ligase [Synergistaceae bacterium]|nr:UDP-N-acetylmuramate--L-alanine ligase [Synergistaceae bacterium]
MPCYNTSSSQQNFFRGEEKSDMMKNIKRVHLMGIGGAGMSALAKLLSSRGLEVSGCDLKPPHYDLGSIPFKLSHSPEHIDTLKPEALILSSAVSRDNPEVIRAKEKGIKILSRAQALSYMFNVSSGIGIAGAHGKTTTSSMTGLIFLKAGLNPTVYIGANVPDIGSNAVSGSGKYFVAELDESDGTFELFHPETSIITNADWDHVDHYPTRDDVIKAFTRFADGRKEGGALILCAEDEGASRVYDLCGKSRGSILRYGWGKSWDWGAYDLTKTHGGGISCTVSHSGHELGRLELSVSGEHNILNSLAAIAAADLAGIDFTTSAEILRGFHGSERRMQVKGITGSNILVMDDYAHHPSEIRATLSAVSGIYPERRLVVLYQPHRFTRTAMFAGDIARALGMAGKAYILPVYSAGEKERPHSSSEEVIRLSNGKIQAVSFDDALDVLKAELKDGDLLLTMGAGDVYSVGEKFLTVN